MTKHQMCEKGYEYIVSLSSPLFNKLAEENGRVFVAENREVDRLPCDCERFGKPPSVYEVPFAEIGAWAIVELKKEREKSKSLETQIEILKRKNESLNCNWSIL